MPNTVAGSGSGARSSARAAAEMGGGAKASGSAGGIEWCGMHLTRMNEVRARGHRLAAVPAPMTLDLGPGSPRTVCVSSQVLQIDIDSPCSLVNLRAGDLILKVEGKPLDKPLPERLQQKDMAGKHIVLLEVRRPPSVRGSTFHADL